MGQSGDLIAVADTGPLIHLHEIGRFQLLTLFSQIHIPQTVWCEATLRQHPSEMELESLGIMRRHQATPRSLPAPTESFKLHQGELECLNLCRELKIPLLLTDDLDARNAAKELQLQPVGSLGIIVAAFYRQSLTRPEARESLEHLHSISSLFVTRAIVDLAVEQLDSHG
jgi:predicted nucleic acid-binding protein